MLRFSWDPEKAAINARKHGVTFGEAQTVFGDILALDIDDPTHSQDERPLVIMALASRRLHRARPRDDPHHQRPARTSARKTI